MSNVKRYTAHTAFVAFPFNTDVILAADYEVSIAQRDARIAELEGMLRECANSFALWNATPELRLKVRIDTALAAQPQQDESTVEEIDFNFHGSGNKARRRADALGLDYPGNQQQQGEPHNCDLEGGHLPIGWGGLVFCELCSARLPDEPALAKAEQPAEDGPDEREITGTVADRLDAMADLQQPGSQAQSDLYAAATVWRKHLSAALATAPAQKKES